MILCHHYIENTSKNELFGASQNLDPCYSYALYHCELRGKYMAYFTPAETVAEIKHTLGFMPIEQVKASRRSFEQVLQILELGRIDIARSVLEELIEHHRQYEFD